MPLARATTLACEISTRRPVEEEDEGETMEVASGASTSAGAKAAAYRDDCSDTRWI